MYLEHYYTFKGHFYLQDKEYPLINNLKHKLFTDLRVEIKHKREVKKFDVIFFIALSIWHTNIIRVDSSYVLTIKDKNQIFVFLNNFIIAWLPLVWNIKIELLNKDINYITYEFNSFPQIEELELIYELNNDYLNILSNCPTKMVLLLGTKNLFLKENFSRFLKLPLQLN